ncbi:MAG TPA: DUF3095 family protein, partial [Polyangiaceae bacterium]|nr:DUF3095 family protein [Polyangiaceae bacterium]
MSSSDAVVPVADRVTAELRAASAEAASAAAGPASDDVSAVVEHPESDARREERFYASLGEVTEFRDVMDLGRYGLPPESSLIVLTDVAGSTKAIEAGRYKDVN